MLKQAAFLLALCLTSSATARSPRSLEYTLHFNPDDLSGVTVELRARYAPASLAIAANAHAEYDDKYWRYVTDFRASNSGNETVAVQHTDSVLWQLDNSAGDVNVRYRVNFPHEAAPRSSWKPFLTATGGLFGGPHSFLYPVGFEGSPVTVTLDIPREWRVGTGLSGPSSARTFTAPNVMTLLESPMLVGALSEWSFRAGNISHRVFYWRLPDATPFDTVAFVSGLQQVATKAIDVFGKTPYTDYTFLFQDGAYSGGLEHPNSVTLGAPSADLARNPNATMPESAHEFIHAWNLMAMQPIEYRQVDYRAAPQVAELWFSEGLTMFYADLLMRRAHIAPDSSRIAHLGGLIERYLAQSGNAHFSAEQVSRAEYNAAPDALGDYTASPHLQGELIGALLDFQIRAATGGTKTIDDAMRLMFSRFERRKFASADVQRVVEEVCGCSTASIFDGSVYRGGSLDFNHYLALVGLHMNVTMTPARDGKGKLRPDLSIWSVNRQAPLRLAIGDPNGVWGQAGLHTNDRLVSINGVPYRSWPELREYLGKIAIGDTARVIVQRDSGKFETRVVVRGTSEPIVRIVPIPDASSKQRLLRERWVEGR